MSKHMRARFLLVSYKYESRKTRIYPEVLGWNWSYGDDRWEIDKQIDRDKKDQDREWDRQKEREGKKTEKEKKKRNIS